jgi:uncharacterized protein (TIGR03435 family)
LTRRAVFLGPDGPDFVRPSISHRLALHHKTTLPRVPPDSAALWQNGSIWLLPERGERVMTRWMAIVAFAVSVSVVLAQSAAPRPKFDAFEVATVKPVDPDPTDGRYIKMQGINRFVEKAYTLKLLIAAAYDLNPKTISGGPSWLGSDHYDILAVTPGEVQPTHDEQMSMLRSLLTDRFKLTFHREQKDFSIYELQVTKNGPKLKASASHPDEPAVVGPGVVYPPHRVVLPARNAAMGNFVSLLQRAILDRPVVDKTGLSGRYGFDLEWAPDETQFSGGLPQAPEGSQMPPLFEAIQQQLGLKLEATRGPVAALVVDQAERPTAN